MSIKVEVSQVKYIKAVEAFEKKVVEPLEKRIEKGNSVLESLNGSQKKSLEELKELHSDYNDVILNFNELALNHAIFVATLDDSLKRIKKLMYDVDLSKEQISKFSEIMSNLGLINSYYGKKVKTESLLPLMKALELKVDSVSVMSSGEAAVIGE